MTLDQSAEILRLRAEVARLTAVRVFVPDPDGGRFVECSQAFSNWIDHLEQRAKGAELALLAQARGERTGPEDPADLNPDQANAPHQVEVRNPNGSHR